MVALTESDLADPAELPGRDVVVWDGRCNYCRKQVLRLARFDRQKQLSYVSLHDPRVAQWYPNLSHQELMEQLWVMTTAGDQFGGADAGRYLSRKLKGLWWLAPMLHIPFSMPLWRTIYGMIAKRRYRISGEACDEDGTCELHLAPKGKREA